LDAFSIAFVCTGNRFRSPLAEAFVRKLTRGMPVTTESYGTLSLEGAPPLPEALEIATSCGISLANHRSRYVNNAQLAEVDLLIGFEPTHVQQAVVDARAPRERSFTARDLLALLAAAGPVPPESDPLLRARSLVALAAERAARASGLMSRGMDDPFGGTRNVYRQSASEIRDLSITLARTLFGVSDADRVPPIPGRFGRARTTLRP
jgi:protein-tyrosine-phosphatase